MTTKIPKSWQIKTLGEVCINSSSNLAAKDVKDKNGKFPVFGASGIIGYIDEFQKEKQSIGVVKDGAGIGRIFLLPPNSSIISTLHYLETTQEIEILYLYYLLSSLNLSKYGSGSAIPHIYFKDYKKEIIYLPSVAEQREIVSEIERRFEKLDKAIENFRQILKNLKLYRQSVLKFAFDAKFTNPNLTNWQTKPLGEVAITSSGGTPSRKNKYFWENGEINWLKSGELNDDFINFTEEKITQEAINKSSAKILPKGTLLIAMYGATIGKLGILNLETSTNQAICAIQNKKEILFEVKFLFYFLLFNRKKMINEAFGGAQKNISQMYLKNLQIPLPPLSEQKQIVSEIEKKFAKADKIENLINKSLKNAEILKQSILKQAFSGNLKVKK